MARDIIIRKFDSPLDFLEWATHAPFLWKGALTSREENSARTEWAGTKNYEEAYHLALYGWEEGIRLLSEQVHIAQRLAPIPVLSRRRYDVAGFYPDPARAAAGEMFNMVAQGDSFKQKPVVSIRANFGYNAGVGPEKIMRWGGAVFSYINALEKGGFSVQLDCVAETRALLRGPSLSFQFPLKKAGEPLSLATVAFWCAHPAALRRIEFSAMERLDVEEWYAGNYGQATTVTAAGTGVLCLSIRDARDGVAENLEVIRGKHLGVSGPGNAAPVLRI